VENDATVMADAITLPLVRLRPRRSCGFGFSARFCQFCASQGAVGQTLLYGSSPFCGDHIGLVAQGIVGVSGSVAAIITST